MLLKLWREEGEFWSQSPIADLESALKECIYKNQKYIFKWSIKFISSSSYTKEIN